MTPSGDTPKQSTPSVVLVTGPSGAGRSTAINALEDRMLVLAGLAAVDWVVPFPEDTPRSLIADVLPDVLVKGGDYTPAQIAGAKEVLQNGGEVRVLPFRDGHSSSRIIAKLRD